MLILKYILTAVIAYLLGSISFGLILAKLTGGPDLRSIGSGSTGATNALRALGRAKGILVFLLDALKAILSCFIGLWLTGSHYGMMLGGLVAIIGHCWPIYYGFKGGKGVSSAYGVMFCTFHLPAIVVGILTLAIIFTTHLVSLGSLTMVLLFILAVGFFGAPGDLIALAWAIAIAVIIIWRHRANIQRLLAGKENKVDILHHKK